MTSLRWKSQCKKIVPGDVNLPVTKRKKDWINKLEGREFIKYEPLFDIF
jgi:hypothetical protein